MLIQTERSSITYRLLALIFYFLKLLTSSCIDISPFLYFTFSLLIASGACLCSSPFPVTYNHRRTAHSNS